MNEFQPKTMSAPERSFGIVFAVVFALIGLYPLIHGGDIRLWALASTLVFGGLAFLWPSLLAPLNRLWFRFGMLRHKVPFMRARRIAEPILNLRIELRGREKSGGRRFAT
jgi:hypothetical protein